MSNVFLAISEDFVFSRTRVQYQLASDDWPTRTGMRSSSSTRLPSSSVAVCTTWTKSLGSDGFGGRTPMFGDLNFIGFSPSWPSFLGLFVLELPRVPR